MNERETRFCGDSVVGLTMGCIIDRHVDTCPLGWAEAGEKIVGSCLEDDYSSFCDIFHTQPIVKSKMLSIQIKGMMMTSRGQYSRIIGLRRSAQRSWDTFLFFRGVTFPETSERKMLSNLSTFATRLRAFYS